MSKEYSAWELILTPLILIAIPVLLVWCLVKFLLFIIEFCNSHKVYNGCSVEFNDQLYKIISTTRDCRLTLQGETGEVIKEVPLDVVSFVDPLLYRLERMTKPEEIVRDDEIDDDWLLQ